jgi:hypothetical protein
MPAAKSFSPGGRPVKTDMPARLDRLPWSRFHLLNVVGLGVTWILDGLEVTIVGVLGPALQNPRTLHLSSTNLGAGDRLLLRSGDCDRGKPLAASVRLADWVRIELDGEHRICVIRAVAAHRSGDGMEAGHRRGRQIPGKDWKPAFEPGVKVVSKIWFSG